MDSTDFASEVVSFMDGLGLCDLEGSGIRFPLLDWESCCRACVWLVAMGHVLPGSLSSRMLLGPMSPAVRVYCALLSSAQN